MNEPAAITSNGGGDAASVAVAENTTAVTNVELRPNPEGDTDAYTIWAVRMRACLGSTRRRAF